MKKLFFLIVSAYCRSQQALRHASAISAMKKFSNQCPTMY